MFGKIVIDGSGEVPKHAVTPSSEFRVQRDTVEYGVSTRARISSEKNELNGRVIHTLIDRLVVDAECAMNLQGLAVVVRNHHLTLLVAVRYRAGYPRPLI